MTDSPTLREVLASLRAQALLEPKNAPVAPELTIDEVASALTALGQKPLPAAKLGLLRASLSDFDVHAAALRMTANQAQHIKARGARRPKSKSPRETPPESLGIAGLDAMTIGTWAEVARWLIEQAGFTLDERPLVDHGSLLAWRARYTHAKGKHVVVCALRLPQGVALLDADMRRMVTLASNEPDAGLVAFTTAEATVGARLIAREAGADLRDRVEVERLLSGLATAYVREREQLRDDAKAQAKAATATRKKLIASLTAADKSARAAPAAQSASGRAAVRKAAEQAREARQLASQALLAWETLIAAWLATFGERPARDGSLPLLAQPDIWVELGERADHLKKPLVDALRALTKTPGGGDLGYAAWRQAIGEELAARCSALLLRASMIDPSFWQDYAASVNDLALQQASRADNAASHAAARAERARSEMAERAGVA